jgi:hypothetical protein
MNGPQFLLSESHFTRNRRVYSNDDDLELLAHIGRNGIAFWYG